jgi:hypothetical protein
MRVAGICHVCGKPSVSICASCGMITCGECIDSITGMCPNCSPAEIYDDTQDDEDTL